MIELYKIGDKIETLKVRGSTVEKIYTPQAMKEIAKSQKKNKTTNFKGNTKAQTKEQLEGQIDQSEKRVKTFLSEHGYQNYEFNKDKLPEIKQKINSMQNNDVILTEKGQQINIKNEIQKLEKRYLLMTFLKTDTQGGRVLLKRFEEKNKDEDIVIKAKNGPPNKPPPPIPGSALTEEESRSTSTKSENLEEELNIESIDSESIEEGQKAEKETERQEERNLESELLSKNLSSPATRNSNAQKTQAIRVKVKFRKVDFNLLLSKIITEMRKVNVEEKGEMQRKTQEEEIIKDNLKKEIKDKIEKNKELANLILKEGFDSVNRLNVGHLNNFLNNTGKADQAYSQLSLEDLNLLIAGIDKILKKHKANLEYINQPRGRADLLHQLLKKKLLQMKNCSFSFNRMNKIFMQFY